jgi:hypothetical protein
MRADPFYLPAYRMLAHILAAEGQRDEAHKVWDEYLRRTPESVNARLAMKASEVSNAR